MTHSCSSSSRPLSHCSPERAERIANLVMVAAVIACLAVLLVAGTVTPLQIAAHVLVPILDAAFTRFCPSVPMHLRQLAQVILALVHLSSW